MSNMPPQPTTKELPAADPVLVAVTAITREVLGLRADVALLSSDFARDIGEVRVRVLTLEEARRRNSDRARSASQMDLAHDAQIAQERMAREALSEKVETLLGIAKRLDKIASNPLAKTLAAMLATALVTWLASHGVHAP